MLICTTVLLVGCNDHLEVIDTSKYKEVELVGVNNTEDISFLLDEDQYFDKLIYTYYPMPNLSKYEFYKVEDVLYADYYFLENSKRDEIQNSSNMFMDVFLINKLRPLGLTPPKELVEMNLLLSQVNYRVFIGDRNIILNNIDIADGSIESNYFEDSRVKLPSRDIMTEAMQEFKKKIERKFWWSIKDVSFQKVLMGMCCL
ncbi:hypothetical protein EDD79_102440 [Serpentinicella alkaliphila]|uniref:Uncharacterized protein n=2 Tax=Serpentinicella alkaliphila TaxID=1734049 RepID=A0A4R2TVP4_9FIRM|nr:hypothetical protein EDD79_102440 [Serpentinicella alkaliphila]